VRLLILGNAFDATARALAERLRARHGSVAVQQRTLEELAAARWTHRLGPGGTRTDVRFSDNTTLAEFAPTLVFNRLEYVPTLLFARMAPADRDYARTEFFALLLSWLASIDEIVVNRATPSGLSGPALRRWQWIARAAEAGLHPYPGAATTNARRSPPPPGVVPRPELLHVRDEAALAQLGFARPLAHAPRPHAVVSLLVLGDAVVGDGAERCGADAAVGSIRLARAVGAELLTVQLAQVEGDPRWRFLAADARPEVGEESALTALADWVEARA
jgi:hypothetical protein